MIEAFRLTSDANRLPRTQVLQVKSTSDFAYGNKIKGTLRRIKDRSERWRRERM